MTLIIEDDDEIISKIDEASTNLSQTVDLPYYCKYRYTFHKDHTLDQQIKIAKNIIKHISDKWLVDKKIVAGIEHYTKGMLATKPHLHIHFVTKTKSDTIRKGLLHSQNLQAGRCQCVKNEVLVQVDKFFRYPLKQQKGESKKWFSFAGFEKDEVQIMLDVAYECWIQSAQISINKMEKKIERTSEDRLFYVLDKYYETETPANLHDVIKVSINYFIDNEPTFNYSTILGYTEKYLLSKNKITLSQYIKYKGTDNLEF